MNDQERAHALQKSGLGRGAIAAILNVEREDVTTLFQGDTPDVSDADETVVAALAERVEALEEGGGGGTDLGPLDDRVTALEDAPAAPKIIRGTILDDGTKVRGTGFTSARTAAGVYVATFTTAFAARPVVVASLQPHANFNTLIRVDDSATDATKVTFAVYNVTGQARDNHLEFVAVAV